MAKVGIDFGTSNSSVVLKVRIRDKKVVRSLLRVNSSNCNSNLVDSVPTEVFITKENKKLCGFDIRESIRDAGDKNLCRNFKEKLINDDEKFIKIDGKEEEKWEFYKTYMQYLIKNANNSQTMIINGERVTEVVLSYPYNCSTFYTTKMKEYMESIDFEDSNNNKYRLNVVGLQEEAVAISLNYFANNPNKKNTSVLVCDIGGGTTDLSIVEDCNGQKKVVSHDGWNEAGNHIDKLIIRNLIDGLCSIDEFFSETNSALQQNFNFVKKIKRDIEGYGELNLNLYLKNERIFSGMLTEEKYYEIIYPFIKKIIDKCEELMKLREYDVSAIILAGGVANCKKVQELFKQNFNTKFSIPVISTEEDKCLSTALGNFEFTPKTRAIGKLNHSYALRVFNYKTNREALKIIFHKDETLPIEEKYVPLITNERTNSIYFRFYVGNDSSFSKGYEYDFSKYTKISQYPAEYYFDYRVPIHTDVHTFFSMDVNGIMKIKIKTDYGKDQIITIKDLK